MMNLYEIITEGRNYIYWWLYNKYKGCVEMDKNKTVVFKDGNFELDVNINTEKDFV